MCIIARLQQLSLHRALPRSTLDALSSIILMPAPLWLCSCIQGNKIKALLGTILYPSSVTPTRFQLHLQLKCRHVFTSWSVLDVPSSPSPTPILYLKACSQPQLNSKRHQKCETAAQMLREMTWEERARWHIPGNGSCPKRKMHSSFR